MNTTSHWPKFWFSRLFLGQVGNTALCLKIISQKWTSFVFACTYLHQTFTECVSNQYGIRTFWYINISDVTASYGTPFDFIAFLSIFIHYNWPFMSELLYLYQTFTNYVPNQYRWFVNMPDMTASYRMPLDFIGNFAHNWRILLFWVFYVWSVVSPPNFPRLCVESLHTFWYIYMPDVATSNCSLIRSL